MTQRFILDENVLILAERGENEQGERDSACLNLFTSIITICHSLVIDHALWGKYQSQLSSASFIGNRTGSQVLAVLGGANRVSGKLIFGPDAPAFREEQTIPQGSQDDVPIVRLAVESGATLVTTDQALVEDLNSCGVQEKYGLQVLSPEEALSGL